MDKPKDSSETNILTVGDEDDIFQPTDGLELIDFLSLQRDYIPDLGTITAQQWTDLWSGLQCLPQETQGNPEQNTTEVLGTVALPPFNASKLLNITAAPHQLINATAAPHQLINASATPCHLNTVPSGVQHTLGSAQTIPTMLLPVQPLGITRTTVP